MGSTPRRSSGYLLVLNKQIVIAFRLCRLLPAEPFILRNSRNSFTSRMRTGFQTILCIGFIWTLFFSCYACFLHATFQTFSLDTALHAQLLWNLSRGRFMETSFLPYCFAGNHFWPGLYLFVPFQSLFGVYGILVLQTFFTAAGAIPVYLLAQEKGLSDRLSTAMAIAYLCCPTIASGVTIDIHFELFSIPFALYALLGVERRKWWWPLCLLLAVSIYEVHALVWFFFGLFRACQKENRVQGFVLAFSCFAWLALVFFFIMPMFRDGFPFHGAERYERAIPDFMDWAKRFCANPIREGMDIFSCTEFKSLRILWPFAFLPLFGLLDLLPAVPLWILLSVSSFQVQSDVRFGYFVPILPFLILSAIRGGLQGQKRFPHMTAFALLVCALSCLLYFQVEKPRCKHPFLKRENLAEIRSALTLIPEHASVSADGHLGAHLWGREILINFPDTVIHGKEVEWIFLDLKENNTASPHRKKALQKVLEQKRFKVVFDQNGVLLLQRK